MIHTENTARGGPDVRRLARRSGGRRGSGKIGAGAYVVPPAGGAKVPVYARAGRFLYALLASVFVAGVVVQVFFAGMGAFGADWDWHTTFVHFLEPLPLLMVPVAFVGQMPWGLRLVPFGLTVLIGLQYAFASAVVPAAALHPVNALLILLLGIGIARRAWSSAAERKKG